MTKVALLYDSYSMASSFDPHTQNTIIQIHRTSGLIGTKEHIKVIGECDGVE